MALSTVMLGKTKMSLFSFCSDFVWFFGGSNFIVSITQWGNHIFYIGTGKTLCIPLHLGNKQKLWGRNLNLLEKFIKIWSHVELNKIH